MDTTHQEVLCGGVGVIVGPETVRDCALLALEKGEKAEVRPWCVKSVSATQFLQVCSALLPSAIAINLCFLLGLPGCTLHMSEESSKPAFADRCVCVLFLWPSRPFSTLNLCLRSGILLVVENVVTQAGRRLAR